MFVLHGGTCAKRVFMDVKMAVDTFFRSENHENKLSAIVKCKIPFTRATIDEHKCVGLLETDTTFRTRSR